MTNSPNDDKQLALVRTFSDLAGELPLQGTTLARDRLPEPSITYFA
jgi:hypothetical protein